MAVTRLPLALELLSNCNLTTKVLRLVIDEMSTSSLCPSQLEMPVANSNPLAFIVKMDVPGEPRSTMVFDMSTASTIYTASRSWNFELGSSASHFGSMSSCIDRLPWVTPAVMRMVCSDTKAPPSVNVLVPCRPALIALISFKGSSGEVAPSPSTSK